MAISSRVGVGVAVGACVAVAVGVAVGTGVGVGEGVAGGTGVGVAVGEWVAVGVGVAVGTAVAVCVAVAVGGTGVGVAVAVGEGVAVGLGVAVGEGCTAAIRGGSVGVGRSSCPPQAVSRTATTTAVRQVNRIGPIPPHECTSACRTGLSVPRLAPRSDSRPTQPVRPE